jgi:hypothetical protein
VKKQDRDEIAEYVHKLYSEKDTCEFDEKEKLIGRWWDALARLKDDEEEFWSHHPWRANRDAQKLFWAERDYMYRMIKKVRELKFAY